MKRKLCLFFYIVFISFILGGCTSQNKTVFNTIDFNAIDFSDEVAIKYANQFSIQKSKDYSLITIVDNGRFLLINEGKDVPLNVPGDITIIKKPVNKAYLVASNAFDPVSTINALDNIRLSGIKKENLYIENAVNAIENGNIIYAGKYNTPDYELLLTEGCDLAIENSMIYHNPETKEKLESLGIPVLVEKSSYESDPLGRLEWVKLYGVLFDKEKEAEQFFENQVSIIENITKNIESKDKVTIAFFHVNSNGIINVRKPKDYIVKLIEMAGATYALKQLEIEEENSLSTINMQMEDFYIYAKDADYLIYNSTIVGEINTIDELIEKNGLFADFKAVRSGQVYCTERNFFQETSGMGNLMIDLNKLITVENADDFIYLNRLK